MFKLVSTGITAEEKKYCVEGGENELLKRENSENLTEKRGKNSQVEEG